MIDFFSPISPAVERTRSQLFRPFDIGKWFALGFSAWLASFISNVGFGSTYSPFDHADGDKETWHFVLQMGLPAWVAIVLGVGFLVWLVMGLLCWLGCRGKFMLLDNVLHGRSEVIAPWKAFRQSGNSLFLVFFLAISIAYAFCLILILFAMVYLWPDLLVGRTRDLVHYLPLGIGGAIFLLIAVGISIYLFFLREFGTLLMYRHRVSAWEASRRIGTLATEMPLHFILYLLIRICMTMVFIIIISTIACLTCCIGILPYLGSVLTLPLSIFVVWYNLMSFAQFGPDYDVRLAEERSPVLPTTI